MICMNYDHNKKIVLLKFNSGYGKIYFNQLGAKLQFTLQIKIDFECWKY